MGLEQGTLDALVLDVHLARVVAGEFQPARKRLEPVKFEWE
jgi:hypothetical protein